MHGQQGQPDAAGARGRDDAPGELRRVVVGAAARAMVQVVELDAGGVPGLQHLELHERRDRLDVVGVQAIEEAVHEPAPRPERVRRIRTAPLGEPGHGALEGVAVQVDGGGQQQGALVDGVGACRVVGFAIGGLAVGRCTHGDALDAAVVAHDNAHVVRPPVGQQRLARANQLHVRSRSVLMSNMFAHVQRGRTDRHTPHRRLPCGASRT